MVIKLRTCTAPFGISSSNHARPHEFSCDNFAPKRQKGKTDGPRHTLLYHFVLSIRSSERSFSSSPFSISFKCRGSYGRHERPKLMHQDALGILGTQKTAYQKPNTLRQKTKPPNTSNPSFMPPSRCPTPLGVSFAVAVLLQTYHISPR